MNPTKTDKDALADLILSLQTIADNITNWTKGGGPGIEGQTKLLKAKLKQIKNIHKKMGIS